MIKKFAVLALIGFNLHAFAQEVNETVPTRKRKRVVDNTYVVKFTPTQIVMGDLNFGVEYAVNEMSSLELEIGPNFSNIGFMVSSSHTEPMPGMSTGNTSKAGFFMGLAYRFYPIDHVRVLNHFYISPALKFRLSNYGVVDYSNTLPNATANRNQFIFTFNVGRQWWFSDHFSFDLYGGVGLAYQVHNDMLMQAIYNPDTQMYDYSWKEDRYSGARIAATIGVKFGIGY